MNAPDRSTQDRFSLQRRRPEGGTARLNYWGSSNEVALDEQGDPLYEDVGPTPRFLALSRKYLREITEMDEQNPQARHGT